MFTCNIQPIFEMTHCIAPTWNSIETRKLKTHALIVSFVTTSDLEDPFYPTKKMTLRTLNANTVENVFDSLMLEDQVNGMMFLLSIVKVENIF